MVISNLDPVAGVEWQVELGIHTQYLRGRSDVQVRPLENLDRSSFPEGATVVAWNHFATYSWPEIQAALGARVEVVKVVQRGSYVWTIARVTAPPPG